MKASPDACGTAGERRRCSVGPVASAVSDVLVLAYHAVSPDWPAALAVVPERLDAQLCLLVSRGYEGATVHDAVHAPTAPRTLAVSFDDAYRSVLDLAFPILERYGLPGTVFVPTDFPDRDGPMSWPGIDRWLHREHEHELRCLSWSQLRVLADAGWEIGAHGCSHCDLTQLPDDELERELRRTRERCEDELQRPCRSLAYPYGAHDLRVVEAARKQGFTTGCTVTGALSSVDPLTWPRIGVWRGDGRWSFRAKTSPQTRRLRTMPVADKVLVARRWIRSVQPASRSQEWARPASPVPRPLDEEEGERAGGRTRSLRVLTLIDVVSDLGGAERFAIGLASHLPRDRFDPWICSTRQAELAATSTLQRLGIPHTNLGRKYKWDVHRMLGLVALLRRERFDVIHAHKFGSNVWGALIGRSCGVPVIVAHEHTWSYAGNPLRAWLDGNLIGRLATRFVAVSAADAERMVRIEGVPREKVIVIPAAAYMPRSGTQAGNLRAELGLAPDTPVVVVVAVLRPQKALSVLLEAHAQVLARVPDAQLVIVGDGECRAELEQLARELVLDGCVHFLGRRADVESILVDADVAALSSDFEGTPLFISECMATNTALVATAVGGVPEMVEDGRTGVLVPPRDPAALADAIARLLANPAERERLAAGAASRLPEYRVDAIASRIGQLYETLERESQHRGARRRRRWLLR